MTGPERDLPCAFRRHSEFWRRLPDASYSDSAHGPWVCETCHPCPLPPALVERWRR